MILIVTKANHGEGINASFAMAHEGITQLGELRFTSKTTWARFIGALQRGAVGMRDMEVRLDLAEAKEAEDNNDKHD